MRQAASAFSQCCGSPDVLVRLRISQADAHPVVVQANRPEDNLDQFQAALHLGFQLVFGHEEMGVVLREASDTGQTADLARLLPAIDGSEFGQSHRQVTIAPLFGGVDFDVMRAVHRPQQVTVDVAALQSDWPVRRRSTLRWPTVAAGPHRSAAGTGSRGSTENAPRYGTGRASRYAA